MKQPTTLERRLAIGVGILILAAATDVAIRKAGGYGSDYSRLLIAMSCGVVTGAYLLGRAWSMSRKLAIVILCTLCCGEGFNLWQTVERVMTAREDSRAPARAALKQHQEAEAALKTAEGAEVTSARLSLAQIAKNAADKAYDKELREGGRCKTICLGLKAKAEAAQVEVKSALSEAEGMKLTAIKTAKADLAAHPLPASGTASSDETGIPVWVLDLISAVLLSLGANGLAGSLIAFGAHRQEPAISGERREAPAIDTAGQSDFSVRSDEVQQAKAALFGEQPDNRQSADILAFVRPNTPPPNNSPNGPKPGKRGSARKADVLADIRSRIDAGERFASQEELRAVLIGRFGYIGRSTLSDWLGELKSEVERTTVGRRKMVG